MSHSEHHTPSRDPYLNHGSSRYPGWRLRCGVLAEPMNWLRRTILLTHGEIHQHAQTTPGTQSGSTTYACATKNTTKTI
jgi:hypothetical protein